MYGDMKRHGFQIQNTQMQDAQRISRLMLGVALAYAWLLALGAAVVKRGLRPQIDVRSRRDKSYARPSSLSCIPFPRCRSGGRGAALRNGPSPP